MKKQNKKNRIKQNHKFSTQTPWHHSIEPKRIKGPNSSFFTVVAASVITAHNYNGMPCLPTSFYKHWNTAQTHTADFLSMPTKLGQVYYYSQAFRTYYTWVCVVCPWKSTYLHLRTLNAKNASYSWDFQNKLNGKSRSPKLDCLLT